MTIKSIEEKRKGKIEVDLTGPDGNTFVLLGIARGLCKQLGRDFNDVHLKMTESNYENLLLVFEEEFGDYVDLYI